MALLGSMHRVLQLQQLQKYTTAILLRPSVISTGINVSSVDSLQASAVRRPRQCLYYSSESSDRRKLPDLKDVEKVDIGPGTWKEVYQGILTTQIRMVKLFSLSTSGLGLLMQPIIFQKFSESAGFAIAAGSFISFFTFVTPMLIHWITKKYVTRLEYDEKEDVYSATTLSFFLREKKIRFHVDDVEVPAVPGPFTTFHVKNQSLFVEPRMFEDIEHYGRIMGYDKPIDFTMEDDDDDKREK